MKPLITPKEVLKRAFPPSTLLSEELIFPSDITVAQERYLVPSLGRPLMERLAEEQHSAFVQEYLLPALALYVRAIAQVRIEQQTLPGGASMVCPQGTSPLKSDERKNLRKAMLKDATTLLRRASEFLRLHPDSFPEYSPSHDILNRTSTDGNIVQIR